MTTSIGPALRTARTATGKSLTEVAVAAGISAATLSRIETQKQSIDVALLGTIATILSVSAADLLRDNDERTASDEALVRALASRPAIDRARIVAAASRQNEARQASPDLSDQLDALLATVDMVRDELTKLQKQAQKRRR